jgi:predicted transcriptional regulator
MKFTPCVAGQCTTEGTHCEGCGRTHAEIAETKRLIMALVSFAQRQGYENIEDFSNFVGKTLLGKLQTLP